jgi:hypothetical protein
MRLYPDRSQNQNTDKRFISKDVNKPNKQMKTGQGYLGTDVFSAV